MQELIIKLKNKYPNHIFLDMSKYNVEDFLKYLDNSLNNSKVVIILNLK